MSDRAERFIFLTGGAFTPEAQGLLEQVERPVLDKPIDQSRLLVLIRKTCEPD